MLALPVLAIAAAVPSDQSIQVVGGVPAAPDDFPYAASIQFNNGGLICGGSLLNGNTVLTAASCSRGWHPELMRIRVGSLVRRYPRSGSS